MLANEIQVGRNGKTLVLSQTADDTGVAMVIKCKGNPTVYVDPQVVFASHTLTFYSNYATGAVTETLVFQPSVTAGTLNLADGSDDMTFGELAAIINASKYWGATLVCARPEDIAYKASGTVDAFLGITAASANAKGCSSEAGTLVYFDTSNDTGNGLHYDICFGPEAMTASFATFAGRNSAPDTWDMDTKKLDPIFMEDGSGNVITGQTKLSVSTFAAWVNTITSVSTYGSGTSVVNVYSAGQVSSTLIDTFASGATTVSSTHNYSLQEFMSEPGKRIIVRLQNSAALGSANLTAQGGFGVLA